MKKVLSVLSAMIVAISLCASIGLSASAATNAFSGEIATSPSTEFKDAGGEKEGGWFVDDEKGENFGIGNTEPGDYVVFRDVDFGTTGASKVTLRISFMVTDYSQVPATFGVYVDSIDSKPVATIAVNEDLGHWIEEASMNFTADCNIKAGKHDVFVKWEDNTGSLFGISFTKASAGGTTTPTTSSKPATPTTSSKPTTNTTTSSKPVANNTTSSKAETTSEAASEVNSVEETASATESTAEVNSAEDTASVEDTTDGTTDESKISTDGDGAGQGPDIVPIIILIVVIVLIVAGGVVALILINKKKA